MFLSLGVVAGGVGLSNFLFGNTALLSDIIITGGRLDYCLSLPRPVLLHAIASRSVAHGFGDVVYGIISFIMAGQHTLDAAHIFLFGVIVSATVFVSFMVMVHSLTFWLGNASMIARQTLNAIITLFDMTAKLILFTALPAAFVGAVPLEFVRNFSRTTLGKLIGAATILLSLRLVSFHRGLRRYESGSAIQV